MNQNQCPGSESRSISAAEGKEPEESGKRSIKGFVKKVRKTSYPGKQRQELEARKQPVVSNAAEKSDRVRPGVGHKSQRCGDRGLPCLSSRQHVGVLGARGGLERAGRTPGREHKPAAIRRTAEAKEERVRERETLNMKLRAGQ